MGKVGRFITDPKAGAYCQVTLDTGDKLVVNHARLENYFNPPAIAALKKQLKKLEVDGAIHAEKQKMAAQLKAQIEWLRTRDTAQYSARLGWAGSARVDQGGPHEWMLSFDRADRPLELVVSFSEKPGLPPAAVDETRSSSARSTLTSRR